MEVGTVTPLAQPGNDQPRLFRLPPDEALVNRMGFNNLGAEAMAGELARLKERRIPVAVNIGKTRLHLMKKHTWIMKNVFGRCMIMQICSS